MTATFSHLMDLLEDSWINPEDEGNLTVHIPAGAWIKMKNFKKDFWVRSIQARIQKRRRKFYL